jgi:hypothetical protein
MTQLFDTEIETSPEDGLISAGRYRIPKFTGDFGPVPMDAPNVGWTRSSTFAKAIEETYNLNNWKLRRAVSGIAVRPDLIALAAAHSFRTREDEETLKGVVGEALAVGGESEGRNWGTAVHRLIQEAHRTGTVVDPSGLNVNRVEAYFAALEGYGISQDADMSERVIVNTRYGVAGRFDGIYRGRIGDVKTSRTLDYSALNFCVQLAMYANADAIYNPETRTFEPMPETDRETALVFHIPIKSDPRCDIHEYDIAWGWRIAETLAAVRGARGEANSHHGMVWMHGSRPALKDNGVILAGAVHPASTAPAVIICPPGPIAPETPPATEPPEFLATGPAEPAKGRKCGKCGKRGHNARTCPTQPAAGEVLSASGQTGMGLVATGGGGVTIAPVAPTGTTAVDAGEGAVNPFSAAPVPVPTAEGPMGDPGTPYCKGHGTGWTADPARGGIFVCVTCGWPCEAAWRASVVSGKGTRAELLELSAAWKASGAWSDDLTTLAFARYSELPA